jgi:ADP-ribose pyrophosphatase
MTNRILPKNAHLIPKEAKQVFKGQIFDVYQWQQKLFNGTTATFEMLRRPDTVEIIAIDDDDQIVTIDEDQPGGVKRRGHLPIGRVDQADESILVAAQRELLEETGLIFKDWRLLEAKQPETKIEWFVYVFVASTKLSQEAQRLDAGERIAVRHTSFETVRELEQFKISSLRDIKSIKALKSYI